MAQEIYSNRTNNEFDKFDMSFLGQNTDDNASDESLRQTAHLGIFFNVGGDLGYCYDILKNCNINIENPLEAGSLENLAYWLEAQEMTGEEAREMLIEQGYDGIVFEDEEFGGTSYVVFSTDQIEIIK